jgi:hypothetical protein
MKLTNEQLGKVKKFYQDPDWFLVQEEFMNYLEPLLNIRNLDHKGTALSVKGEVKAKIQLYNEAVNFFANAQITRSDIETEQRSDSCE